MLELLKAHILLCSVKADEHELNSKESRLYVEARKKYSGMTGYAIGWLAGRQARSISRSYVVTMLLLLLINIYVNILYI